MIELPSEQRAVLKRLFLKWDGEQALIETEAFQAFGDMMRTKYPSYQSCRDSAYQIYCFLHSKSYGIGVRAIFLEIIASLHLKSMPEADYFEFIRLYKESVKTEELKQRYKRLNSFMDYRIIKLVSVVYGRNGSGRDKKKAKTCSRSSEEDVPDDCYDAQADDTEEYVETSLTDSSFSVTARDFSFGGLVRKKRFLHFYVPINSPNLNFIKEAVDEETKVKLDEALESIEVE